MVAFEEVAGLQKQKEFLSNTLLLPLEKKELYAQLVKSPEHVQQQKNFLFTGPPGSGKTYLAEAFASKLHMPFTRVDSTEVLDEYVGRGAKSLRELYSSQEGIVFLDEIDAIGKKRSLQHATTQDLIVQLLFCLGRQQKPYATFAATNQPEVLDDALRSRFTYVVEFQTPDASQRKAILDKRLSYYAHKVNSLDDIVGKTEGFDARKLVSLFSFAETNALQQDRSYLSCDDLLRGVSYVT